MLEEVLRCLDPRPGETFLDATVGYGGHAEPIAARLGEKGRLIGIDLDSEALSATRKAAKEWPCRTEFEHAGYDEMPDVLDRLGIGKVDGLLADLGVSSPQLDRPERGFSFQGDGPLDMRMDPEGYPTAAEWLAAAEEREIRRALWEFGEEKRAAAIAKALVRERRKRPIDTTGDLTRIVLSCFPDRDRAGRVHPATRTYQALRIVVNHELERLERLLSFLPDRLGPGGRVVILAYHSLEDRLVKRAFQEWSGKSDPVLSRIPIRGEIPGRAIILTPKALRPSPAEVARNPRSRSARLRAAKRTSLA
ncbi:MAG: 16S rRNA (cytosine(1402)-N(4))-methyltransferase RsmH [Candidatus Omnitrophica bacterium]|nr:16S rRNA (cytosine(1402)-N(4))-methyltransferase RsmH [Candidatus Omnitrophota bacterium]